MSNFVYGYLITSDALSVLDGIKQIVESQPLGFIVRSKKDLLNFPSVYLPQTDNNVVFFITDSKDKNTAQYLLDDLDYFADIGNDLPRQAKGRQQLLIHLITTIVKLEQVEKLYVALTDNSEIEAVTVVVINDLNKTILSNCSETSPPNILYIVEKILE